MDALQQQQQQQQHAEAEATLTNVIKQARTALLTSVSPLLATRDHQVEEQRERIAELQDAHERVEKREAALLARHRALQGDYHNLITIASELVQTLTACINGEKVSKAGGEGTSRGKEVFIRKVLTRPADEFMRVQRALESRAADPAPLAPQSAPRQLPPISRRPSAASPAPSPAPTAAPAAPPTLDLTKISTDLQRSDEAKVSQLLQALRLLATRAPNTPAQTRRVLQSYITADLFLLRTTSPLLPSLLESSHPDTSLQTAMLLNAMTSISAGRGYLLLCAELIPTLLTHTFSTPPTPAHHHHALLTLQKLSLRRYAQTQMNDAHTLTRLFAMLETGDLDALPQATVEYASALVMNLCLRTKGKKECMGGNEDRVLRVLSAVMEVESLQVKTYINGTLYSLFSEPSLRDAARAQGMEDMLSYMRESEDEQLVGQIDFVLKQLAIDDNNNNNNRKKQDGVENTEDGENDDKEEESGEADSAESEDGEEDDDDEMPAESGSENDDDGVDDEREHDADDGGIGNGLVRGASAVAVDPALVLAAYYVTPVTNGRKPSVSVPTRPATPLASSLRSSFVKKKGGGGGVIAPSMAE
ncbi:LisH domain-containing protein armc9 [Geranomyces michiganensis]|nr:LisH domain-containing protein armc9 [Geranomyces michiganensis]